MRIIGYLSALFLITSLGLSITPSRCTELSSASGSLPVKMKHIAKEEIKAIRTTEDGSKTAVVSGNILTVRDSAGRAVLKYKAPKAISGLDASLVDAYPFSNDINVVKLALSDDVDPCAFVLVGLDPKGHVLWKKNNIGAVVTPSPSRLELLATDPELGRTEMINAKTGNTVWSTKSVSGEFAVFSPDGSYVAVSGNENSPGTTLLDRTGQPVWTLPSTAEAVAISKGAMKTAVALPAGSDGEEAAVVLVDKKGAMLWRRPMKADAVSIDENGSRILLGDGSRGAGQVRLLDDKSNLLWDSPKAYGEWTYREAVQMSADGRKAMFTLQSSGRRYLYLIQEDGKRGQRLSASLQQQPTEFTEGFVQFSAHGSRLIVRGDRKAGVLVNKGAKDPLRGKE